MNCKEHHLPELELATGQVREALQCILHTILFIRSPGSVVPQDVECDGFDLTYARIASDRTSSATNTNGSNNNQSSSTPTTSMHTNVEQKVDDAIEAFLRTLSQIGPELMSGSLVLSFYERRASKQLFGLVSHEERLVWEQWILRVVVNNTRPMSDNSAAVIERQRLQDTAEGMLRAVLMQIFEIAGGDIQHIPPVMYEFDILSTKRVDERENVYARVANMPSLIHLGN
ncbi:Autophagy-related protein [Fragilaria crotonensis]|nr:Autophagy-related protein [Fragilaria crotonensis]